MRSGRPPSVCTLRVWRYAQQHPHLGKTALAKHFGVSKDVVKGILRRGRMKQRKPAGNP